MTKKTKDDWQDLIFGCTHKVPFLTHSQATLVKQFNQCFFFQIDFLDQIWQINPSKVSSKIIFSSKLQNLSLARNNGDLSPLNIKIARMSKGADRNSRSTQISLAFRVILSIFFHPGCIIGKF